MDILVKSLKQKRFIDLIQNLQYILSVTIYLTFSTIVYAQSEIKLPVSFQANFEQSITNDKKKKISYSGKIQYSSQYFKWIYATPTKKSVCTDSQELIVVDHDLEQVSTYMMDEALDLPSILQKAELHRKTVYIASYKGKNYTIQVDKKKRLSRIAYKDNLI